MNPKPFGKYLRKNSVSRLLHQARQENSERTLASHESAGSVDDAWVGEAERGFSSWERKATKTVSADKASRDTRKKLRR